MGDVRSGKESGGVPAFIPLAFLVLVIGGIGLLITTRVRKQRRVEAEQLAEVRGSVREDVVELGDEIRALDLDISMPGASEEAKQHYEEALGAYERASSAVDRVREPAGPRARRRRRRGGPLRDGLRARPARGPRARPSARRRASSTRATARRPARSSGRRRSASRARCPPARPTPSASSAARTREAREITLGGRRMPYWDAGPAYAPYMGGFFGGGLLPGLFLGSLLSDGMWTGGFGGITDSSSGSSEGWAISGAAATPAEAGTSAAEATSAAGTSS